MRPAAALPMLGIDLGGTKIEAAGLGPDGTEQWRCRVPTPSGDYQATLGAIAALVQQAGNAIAADDGAFSIGIGTPGTPADGGLMKNSNSTCLNGRPLQHDLQTLLQRPVALANDANCLALSEATDGAGAGADTVFAAILGTGVGGGIVVRRQVLGGTNGGAGEWGHNPLPWATHADDPQPACWCGQRGCIESFVSGPALAHDHHRQHGGVGEVADAATIAARAAAGDAGARSTLDRHASRLARALASVINLLDPDVIVLGGGLSRMPHLYRQVPGLWNQWIFGAASEPSRTRLVPALHGDASGVRGAAWIGRAAAPSV